MITARFLRQIGPPTGLAGSLDFEDGQSHREVCNKMFATFNRGSGEDSVPFTGPSMSVRDWVEIEESHQSSIYRCSPISWELLFQGPKALTKEA